MRSLLRFLLGFFDARIPLLFVAGAILLELIGSAVYDLVRKGTGGPLTEQGMLNPSEGIVRGRHRGYVSLASAPSSAKTTAATLSASGIAAVVLLAGQGPLAASHSTSDGCACRCTKEATECIRSF